MRTGGILSAAFCAPWAAPGVPRQALTSLFDRAAVTSWRPDFSLAQTRWLWQFYANCNADSFKHHRRAMFELARLSRLCLDECVARTGITFERRQSGILHLFRGATAPPDPAQTVAAMRNMGIDAQWLDRDATLTLESGLQHTRDDIAGAVFVRGEGSGDCELFTRRLFEWCCANGLQFMGETHVDHLLIDASGTRLRGVRVGECEVLADAVVVATGVGTAQLLRWDLRVPVIPVKGYTLTLSVEGEANAPQHVVIDQASKLAVARFDKRVRLAGFAEVAGHDRTIKPRRTNQLLQQFEQLYGGSGYTKVSEWAGLRPMTPDGTPLVGETPVKGLVLNTGHGTYGWTLACGSARLIADLLSDRTSPLDPAPYAIARYQH